MRGRGADAAVQRGLLSTPWLLLVAAAPCAGPHAGACMWGKVGGTEPCSRPGSSSTSVWAKRYCAARLQQRLHLPGSAAGHAERCSQVKSTEAPPRSPVAHTHPTLCSPPRSGPQLHGHRCSEPRPCEVHHRRHRLPLRDAAGTWGAAACEPCNGHHSPAAAG